MIFLREIKELLYFLPQMSRDVVDVGALTKSGTSTLFNSKNKKNVINLVDGLKKRFDANTDLKIKIVDSLGTRKGISSEAAQNLLTLYFEQLSWDKVPVHFDMRESRFSLDEDNTLQWTPSSLYHAFDPNFLKGVRNLYAGFYLNNESLFLQGLFETKIISMYDAEHIKEEAFAIFQKHFAKAKDGPVRFELETFRESFTQIFSFFIQNKKKLSIDFAYLGFYLTSLYLHLDPLGYELNVKEAYLKSNLTS